MSMRPLLVILLLSVYAATIHAQPAMPADDLGRFLYQEVVPMNGYPASLLYGNARNFMQELSVRADRSKYYSEQEDSLTVYNRGSFGMSNMYTIGKRTDGIVIFDMTVEVKEEKFRYTISNFQYREFERNRYGKFVPANKRDIPLERLPSGLQKKQWEANLEKTDELIQALILELKEKMAFSPKSKSVKKAKKDNIDW
jgi:hypothetical protein